MFSGQQAQPRCSVETRLRPRLESALRKQFNYGRTKTKATFPTPFWSTPCMATTSRPSLPFVPAGDPEVNSTGSIPNGMGGLAARRPTPSIAAEIASLKDADDVGCNHCVTQRKRPSVTKTKLPEIHGAHSGTSSGRSPDGREKSPWTGGLGSELPAAIHSLTAFVSLVRDISSCSALASRNMTCHLNWSNYRESLNDALEKREAMIAPAPQQEGPLGYQGNRFVPVAAQSRKGTNQRRRLARTTQK